MNRKTISILIISFFIVVPFCMFLSSTWLKTQHTAETQLHNATLLPTPQALPAFTLKDIDGNKFDNKNLEGHWSLLFFGFTRCPAICPTTLAELAHAEKILAAQSPILPQVVFISIDPEHDTSAIIKQYVRQFNPNFMGASGNTQQLETLTHALGIMFNKIPTAHNYTMAHSNIILVINPKGEWSAVLTSPYQAELIAEDFEHIIHS